MLLLRQGVGVIIASAAAIAHSGRSLMATLVYQRTEEKPDVGGGETECAVLGQLNSWRPFPLKYPIDEDSVLAVAGHVEIRVVEENLDVPARDETGVAHVDVDVAPAAVAADDDPRLAHQVLELAALEASDCFPFVIGTPLYLGRAGGCRFESK